MRLWSEQHECQMFETLLCFDTFLHSVSFWVSSVGRKADGNPGWRRTDGHCAHHHWAVVCWALCPLMCWAALHLPSDDDAMDLDTVQGE